MTTGEAGRDRSPEKKTGEQISPYKFWPIEGLAEKSSERPLSQINDSRQRNAPMSSCKCRVQMGASSENVWRLIIPDRVPSLDPGPSS